MASAGGKQNQIHCPAKLSVVKKTTVDVDVLIDTGSATNMMSLDLLQRFQGTLIAASGLVNSEEFNAKSGRVLGQAKVLVHMGSWSDEMSFAIVQPCNSTIIAFPALQATGAVIEC